MGGDDKQLQQPTPPAAPTAQQSLQEYIDALPQLFAAEQQFQPQFAQLEKSIQEQLFPQTSGLQELLAGQTTEALGQDVPEWYKNQVADTLRSQLGENLVYNPLAQERFGVGTQQAFQGYQDRFRNFGLSLAGRQPLPQPQSLTSSFTPAGVQGANQAAFGTQANIFGNQLGAFQQQQRFNQSLPFQYLQGAGNVLQGIGSFGGQGSGFLGLKPLGKQ